MDRTSEEFVRQLTDAQPALYGYICSLLYDRQQGWDLLQEVNLTIWKKKDEFTPGSNFMSWVTSIAYHHALAHRRSHYRDKKVFSEPLLETLANEGGQRAAQTPSKMRALTICLEKLTASHKKLLSDRYSGRLSVKEMARQRESTEAAISQLLRRIRLGLKECIEMRLTAESNG